MQGYDYRVINETDTVEKPNKDKLESTNNLMIASTMQHLPKVTTKSPSLIINTNINQKNNTVWCQYN